MSPKVWYRVASILLILFALGHQVGFQQVDPDWHAGAVVAGMRGVHFHVQGFDRSYWDFFSGFGYFVTILLLFAAVLAWQLGGLPKDSPATLSVVRWSFAFAFAVITWITWRFFFVAPLLFSALALFCLVMGAWSAARQIAA